ncbi:MAG: carbohydrate ABC transporter permease [Gaiellaceae bacterium]
MEAAIAPRPSIARRLRRWEGLPYWLILPTVAYLALFFVWPMIQAFELSVHVGGVWTFEPFRTMYRDIRFGQALRFTLLFIAIIIPIQFALALTMALIANSRIRGRTLFLFVFILPLGVSDLSAGLAWSSIFTQHGYLNTILQDLGLRQRPYIWINPQHQTQLVIEIVAAEIWRSTALITVILIAGLQGIPKEYAEAAEVFGAGFFARLRTVTLPMLKPAIQVALLLRIVFAFEVFATVLAIAGQSTTTLALEAWNWQTSYLNPHVAAAYATLILGLSLAAAAIVMILFRTRREQLLR